MKSGWRLLSPCPISLYWDSAVIVFHVLSLVVLFRAGRANDSLEKNAHRAGGSLMALLRPSALHPADSGTQEWERSVHIKKKVDANSVSPARLTSERRGPRSAASHLLFRGEQGSGGAPGVSVAALARSCRVQDPLTPLSSLSPPAWCSCLGA